MSDDTMFARASATGSLRDQARADLMELRRHMRALRLADGTERQVATFGSGSALVCLPMIAELNFVYAPQVERFQGTHRVVIYEPALSSSQRVGIYDRAHETIAIMDALGIGRAHVVAWSDTGSPAYILGRDHAPRCRSISFLGLADRYCFPWPLSRLMHVYERFPIEDLLPAPLLASILARFLGGRQVKRRWVVQLALEVAELPGLFKHSVLPNLTEHAPRSGEVTVPCTVICGDDDALVTTAQAHAMAALVPGPGRATIIEGAEHFLGYVHVEPVNDALHAFLDSVRPKSAVHDTA